MLETSQIGFPAGQKETNEGALKGSPDETVIIEKSRSGVLVGPDEVIARIRERLGSNSVFRAILEALSLDAEKVDGMTAFDLSCKAASNAFPDAQDIRTKFQERLVGSADSSPFLIGEDGNKVAVDMLGEGGFGVVYLVFDINNRSRSAVKVSRQKLPQSYNQKLEYSEHRKSLRFQTETRFLMQLRKTGITFDYIGEGITSGGHPYHETAFIPGQEFSEIMKEVLGSNNAFTTSFVRDSLITWLRAVQILHENNIIHRDLKPGNIYLGDDGLFRIMDFGLSHDITEPEDMRITSSRDAGLGSGSYGAPEQLLSPKTAGGKADIYALGAIAYEMLTGRHPIEGDSAFDIILAHQRHDSPDMELLKQSDSELAPIIANMLSANPEARLSETELIARLFGKSSFRKSFRGPNDLMTGDYRALKVAKDGIMRKRLNRAKFSRNTAFKAGAAVTALAIGAGSLIYKAVTDRNNSGVDAVRLPGIPDGNFGSEQSRPAVCAVKGAEFYPGTLGKGPEISEEVVPDGRKYTYVEIGDDRIYYINSEPANVAGRGEFAGIKFTNSGEHAMVLNYGLGLSFSGVGGEFAIRTPVDGGKFARQIDSDEEHEGKSYLSAVELKGGRILVFVDGRSEAVLYGVEPGIPSLVFSNGAHLAEFMRENGIELPNFEKAKSMPKRGSKSENKDQFGRVEITGESAVKMLAEFNSAVKGFLNSKFIIQN